ncbi:phosphoglycolate phosphatase [Reticulibacter mediterranei]|uniref:Phosphoglycolate phosphatase n=1 Tax=Reticulibacter mediterranei TaxID=2778369 RepID=A0A8J3IN19_9CHLR|nr:HAD family hydrolase [Reticulibacter mediterranei]GHO94564.1 phosphoglycolate phosphatase [Reticulibacter mediterranei]
MIEEKMLKGIIFDLDGTLANTLPLCVRAYQQVLLSLFQREYTASEIIAHFGRSEDGILQQLVPDQWEISFQHYLIAYEQLHWQCPEPFQGIRKLLDLLKQQHVALALVTGKGRQTTDCTLRYLGLTEYFHPIEVGSANGIVKATCIQRVLDEWQIPPQRVAYVGDSVVDMEEAHKAAVLPLRAAWGGGAFSDTGKDAPYAYATFRYVEQFMAWIEQYVEAQ